MLLVIETATRSASVAAVAPDGTCLKVQALPGRDTAAHLAPAVSELLARFGPPQGYVVDLGPGSFTGLRVGLAFAKGLARGRPAPAVGLGSLEVLAAALLDGAPEGTSALPTLSASGGAVFAGRFRRIAGHAVADEALPVGLYPPARVAEQLRAMDARVGGEGWPAVAAALGEDAERGHGVASEGNAPTVPDARTLGRLGAARWAAGAGRPMAELEPAYHQLSAAEAKLRGGCSA